MIGTANFLATEAAKLFSYSLGMGLGGRRAELPSKFQRVTIFSTYILPLAGALATAYLHSIVSCSNIYGFTKHHKTYTRSKLTGSITRG